MTILVCEFNDFVFDRGAIAWTAALDLTAVHRGSMQIVLDQLMNIGVGKRDPTGNLLDGKIVG